MKSVARLLVGCLVFGILELPTRTLATTTVTIGQGTMGGTICPGGLGGCPDRWSFDYAGPIRLVHEHRMLGEGEDHCAYNIDPYHDTYTAYTLQQVQYVRDDGTTGTAFATLWMNDDDETSFCYSFGGIKLTANVDGTGIIHSGGGGLGSRDSPCGPGQGGSLTGSQSQPTSGFFCLQGVPAPEPVFGASWDGTSLRAVLDAEYGMGAIDAAHDYEGFLPGDADPVYWADLGVSSLLVREIAGFDDTNTLGWYRDDLTGPPSIDGVDDGVIFDGPIGEGSQRFVEFPSGATRFGFYLNPNGTDSANNAPEPEKFFTNRSYNDIGPDGSGALHPPSDGDVQCLVYNITHLRGGVPTYVLAWEDLDSGAVILPAWAPEATDNDFNDLVIEVSAYSPVKSEPSSWGRVKALYGD